MSARPRIDSFDLLRGLVMVVMALDHTRDFSPRVGWIPATSVNRRCFDPPR